jgi:predicted negative regulator of RcsB-dependent stress response
MAQNPVQNPTPPAEEELLLPVDVFWEENKGKIIGAILAVLLLAFGGIGIAAWQREQNASARAAFAQASTVEAWRDLLTRYGGTPIGNNSGLLLAAALREQGDLTASSAVYQELLEGRGTFALQSAAALGLAQNDILSETSPTASTTEALQAVATRFPDGYATPYALYTEGDLLLRQGQSEQAQQVFRNLLTDYPDSVPGQLASMQLQRLAEESLQQALQNATTAEVSIPASTEPAPVESPVTAEDASAEIPTDAPADESTVPAPTPES